MTMGDVFRYGVLPAVVGGLTVFVVSARRRRPEQTWEPGLEFDPDFTPTAEEIEADLRGEAPSA